jgi:hypothetical protein
MPSALEVSPEKWSDITVLFDNGEYSVISGRYDGGDHRVLGERWNGGPGPGFPSQGGHPTQAEKWGELTQPRRPAR